MPEKRLLAAVLELAARELFSPRPNQYQRKAASWILYNGGEDGDERFRFEDCVYHLCLSDAQVDILWDRAREVDCMPYSNVKNENENVPTRSINKKIVRYRVESGR